MTTKRTINKGEVEEELFALTSLPPKMRSIDNVRELLCQVLQNNIGTPSIDCNQHVCDSCSLNLEDAPSDDFLINLINLPLK